METTTQEIIYQISALLISGILAIVAAYARKLIATHIELSKYGFENDRVERIISNAVDFAEAKAKEYAKSNAKKMASSSKLDFARRYVDEVDRSVVYKYSKELDDMIARKVQQKFGYK